MHYSTYSYSKYDPRMSVALECKLEIITYKEIETVNCLVFTCTINDLYKL